MSDRRYLRMGTKAGLTPVDQHVDIPTPAERIARLSENIGQRADVLPPRAPIRGEAEPAPPPELAAVSSGEARLGDVVDQSNVETRRRGMRRLLIPPGSAAAATGVERILGENLPGGAGEHFRNIASAHEEEEQAAREQHPLAGAASDVGRLYLELEGLGRLPGAPGRFFREPSIGGAPATRGLFEEGRLTGTIEREGVGTIRDRLARAAGVEGRKFGALEGGRAALERRPPEEIVERGAAGAAGGAIFGAGGQAVTEVASPLIRSTLRGMARRNLPPMESPFMRPGELPSGQPRALLAPPAEPAGAAGMPDHVVNAGAAQRVALELTGQSPEPRPPGQPVAASSHGQSVAPIGTDINDPLRLAGNEARDLSLQRPQTPETRARLKVIQAYIAAHTPPEVARPEEPAAAAAPVAPEREIPAEPPPSTIVETPYEPPKPKPAVIPEGAPEVLGGEAADVGRQAAKPGDVGTLPQPRRKNFKAYDDAALEARWIQISDRMEAMARQRDEGTTPWVRKEERAAGAGTGRGGGFGGYSREKGVLSGTAINASGGRAIGRMKDDTRILGELEREFHARGINPADVMDRYVERANRLQAKEEGEAERRALETQDEGGGDTSFHVAEPRRTSYGVEADHLTASQPDEKARALRGETVPAVRRPDGEIFVAPYHYKAWEMAYPSVKLSEGEQPPSDAREGFMMRGQFHVRSIEKRGRGVSETSGYHGSPHRFEGPFAQSKIGSGQGAASYGHGHYFAQEKATARTYRPRQAVKVTFDGESVPAFVFDRKADEARATSSFFGKHGIAQEDEGSLIDALNFVNAQGSVGAARAELKLGPDDWRTRGALHALDYYGDKIAAEQAGAVYSVTLNVEPYEWLDWDKRLDDQSEQVQSALKDLLRSAWRGSWTGADLYRALEAPTSTEGVVVSLGSGEAASRALRSLGIKGVRYLDQLSREPGKTAKTYNFVVFDAKDIGESTRVEEGKPKLVPSPWLDERAAVTETDAAFGGEQQMQLSLDKAVEQLQLKPEKPVVPPPAAKKGKSTIVAVAHYQKRAAASRKIVADLKKGQATWPGRQFPNVWPSMGTTGEKAEVQYDEMVDSIGTMLQALRSPFVETLVMFATREGKIVTSHVVTSGLVGQASIDAPGGIDLSQLFLEDAQRAGATHVHTAHNHPSGKTDPSGLGGDIGMWGSLTSRADKMGLQPGINLIIDDEQFSVSSFRKEPEGWAVVPRYVPYRYSSKVPWFTPAAGLEARIESPETVAAVVHRLGKRHNGYLIHLSNASAIVGVEAFTPGDSIEEAVASAGSRYGASTTIVGVNDQAGFDRFLETYGKSPTLIRNVMDVVGAFGEGRWKSARVDGGLKVDESARLEQQWLNTITGRRVHEPGPMADPWRGQPGYMSDPAVQGARPIIVPFGFPVDGSLAVREGLGPGYGEDNLPNTASVIAQEAIDAAAKLGLAPAAETTIGKLLTSLAGTRLEQIGGPLHLVLVEYERQRAQLEELVQSDILKESLNKSAVEFLARLPYFNEFRAVSLLAYLRDKLPKAIGKRLGVTPDRQEALFNAAEAIAEFGPDGKPVFRDVLERTGELDQVGYERLLKVYGHPAKLETEVAQLKQSIDGIRRQMGKASVALSPSAYAVERFKLGMRAKQEAKKGAAEQVLASLKAERNAKKAELVELKGQRDLHAKEGILDDDAAAALPAELARVATELDHLRAEISRFEGLVRGRTPAGPAVDPKELPAKLKELDAKLVKWRELRGLAKEHEEVLRGRWSNLRAFRSAYEAQAAGKQAGAVRITEQEARVRWASLSKSEQAVVRRFAQGAARAKEQGLAGHVNRELAKLDYEISSDIEAYVHHYGFEDEGAMVLWFGSALRRKKLIAGARQHRGGVEGFKRHLEGARLHGGLPLALQKLQNEFAEALERVMFTTPDPNLVRPLGEGEEPPDGFSLVLGRFGEFKGQPFAVANTIYKELEFFQKKPPTSPTTDERANRAWELTKRGVSRLVYYWALNQLLSVGTATRNFIGGAIQYATLVAENIAGGDFVAATHNLLALAKAMSPGAVRRVPMTEFGASQQTLRELDQAHGLFRAFMNTALIPFGVVENFFKRALTIGARELEAQRIAKEMLADGTIDKGDVDRVVTQLFDAPTFEMRASEEMTRDAFAYNYNNIPLALKRMNKSAIGKALIPFPIYGYKFARHAGRYVGAVSRLARMKGRAGDLQKAIAAIIIFGIPVVLTWLGDEEGKAKTTDPGSGIKYDFDRSGRIYIGKNDEGNELWVRTNSYSFYGLGAVVGHTLHDRTLIEAKNYVSEFYSVGPGFQAADYLRQVRNRYQTYRNNASIAGDFARSWIPFHRPLETVTRMVDPTRRKQESFTESMLYAIPIPEPVLNQYGLSRGEPRTAMGGAQLVPGYNPLLEFLKEFGGVNIKPINPKQAQDEYRRAAVRAQVRERRSTANSARLRRLELRQRERQP